MSKKGKRDWTPASAEARENKKRLVAKLVDLIREYPCRSANWYAGKINVPTQTVATWLRELVRSGVLRNDRGGRELA